MGLVAAPTEGDYDAGDPAQGPQTYTDISVIALEFNGSIDDANLADDAVVTAKIANDAVDANKLASTAVQQSHVDYTSANSGVLAAQVGPDYAGAGGGRLCHCLKTENRTGTVAVHQLVIVFATHGIDGNPAFSTTPTWISAVQVGPTSVDELLSQRVSALSQTGCTIELTFASTDDTASMEFYVQIWGPIA